MIKKLGQDAVENSHKNLCNASICGAVYMTGSGRKREGGRGANPHFKLIYQQCIIYKHPPKQSQQVTQCTF